MGWTNADNKFGPTKYMVGPPGTLGDGVNYTSIQTAINDINATVSKTGSIYVRPGTYPESPSFPAGTAIQVVAAAGNATTSGICVILGNVDIGAGAGISLSNLFIEGNTTNTAGGALAGEGCVFFATAGDAVTSNGGSTLDLRNCILQVIGAGNAFTVNSGAVDLVICQVLGPVSIGAAGSPLFDNCNIVGSTTIAAGGASGRFGFTDLIGGALTSLDIGAGSVANVLHCDVTSNAVNPITGTGTLFYADVVFLGSGVVLDPALTLFQQNWQPYCLAGTAPGTNLARGTSAFDSAHFSVTQGFVQLVGGPTGITWSDVGVSGSVSTFTGSFATAAISLTLPLGAAEGDPVEFKTTSAAPLTITAAAGQTIQLGSQMSTIAGTCTSTGSGNAIFLTYRSANTNWEANASLGNWILA